MKERPRIQRALLRRALRKQLRRTDEESNDARLISLALDDETVFETCYETAMEDARFFGESSGALSVSINADGEPIVDSLLKLLQWFTSNGPQLLALIEQIIGLFGSVQSAVQIFKDEELFVD